MDQQVLLLKNNRKRFAEILIGNNIDCTVEQQVLRAMLLIACITSAIILLMVIIYKMPAVLIYSSSGIFVSSGFMYFMARILKKDKYTSSIMILIYMVHFSVSWFFTSGISGNAVWCYFVLLGYIIFLTSERRQVILYLVLMVNVSSLFYLEYRFPELVTPYSCRETMFLGMYVCFILIHIFVLILVFILKKLYEQEKRNTVDIIKRYRKDKESLTMEYPHIISLLSLRERDIFERILEGKSNKEIASLYFISESTVKNHITQIYKKLDVSKRTDLINKINIITST